MKHHRRHYSAALLFALVLVALPGCFGPHTTDEDVKKLTHEQVRSLMQRGSESDPVVLIDIREPAAYETGHIPGAINIPDAMINTASHPSMNIARAIVVYGQSFEGQYALSAAKALIRRGFANVYAFSGGMDAWLRHTGGGDDAKTNDAP